MTNNKKLSDLNFDTKNANKHTAKGQKALEDSLQKYGAGRSILVDKNNNIIAGNLTAEVFGQIGLEEVQIVESDGKKLIVVKRTDIDINSKAGRELAISDNRASELSLNWDSDALKDIQENFKVDLSEFFSNKELKLLGLDNINLNEEDFEFPDEIKTNIVLGDLFEIGEHRLLCGDSTDSDAVAKLMNGQKADMVFTDPPFPNNSEIMHDMIKNIDGAFNNSRLFCNKLMIWFWDNLEFPPFSEQVTSKHIWHKTNGWQAGHFETMYCYHNDEKRHEQKVYSVNNVGGENNRKEQGNHPTPKPISLIFEIINDLSKDSKSILDLFLGSGTTMLASHQLKRKCYGMEIDPKYCQVILDRMLKLDPTLKIVKNGKHS